jgi:hypothetical protein
VRNTLSTKKTFGFATAMDPFARAPRGAKMHPRRDEGGHETGKKTGEPDDKSKDDDKSKEKEGDKTPPAKTEAQKAAETTAKAEKKRADDLQAELDAERAKHLSDDEKTRAEEVKTKIANAVTAKETELHEHYGAIIEGYQTKVIDGLINSQLQTVGRSIDDFKTVISTLDKRAFVGEDGAVKESDVTKWASELAGSYSSKPPRNTKGPRSGGVQNRGMGQYLED